MLDERPNIATPGEPPGLPVVVSLVTIRDPRTPVAKLFAGPAHDPRMAADNTANPLVLRTVATYLAVLAADAVGGGVVWAAGRENPVVPVVVGLALLASHVSCCSPTWTGWYGRGWRGRRLRGRSDPPHPSTSPSRWTR